MYLHIYVHARARARVCVYITVVVQRMRRRMNDPHPERIDYTKYRALLCVHLPTTSSSSNFIAIKQQPSPGLTIPLLIVIK